MKNPTEQNPTEQDPTKSPDDAAETLDKDVKLIRYRLDNLVGELDRRRHQATDLRAQWHVHKTAIIAAAGGLLLISAGSVWAVRARHEAARKPTRRFERAMRALGGVARDRQAVAKPSPAIGSKIARNIASAVLVTVATFATRRVLADMFKVRATPQS